MYDPKTDEYNAYKQIFGKGGDGITQMKIIVDFLKKPLNGTDKKTVASLLSGPIQIKNPRIER